MQIWGDWCFLFPPRCSFMGRSASALHRRTSPCCLTRAPLTSGCPLFAAFPCTRHAVSLDFWWGTDWLQRLLEVRHWYFPLNSPTSLFSAPSSLQLQQIQHVCSERQLVFHQVPDRQFVRLHQRGHGLCEFQKSPAGKLLLLSETPQLLGFRHSFCVIKWLVFASVSFCSPDCRLQACVCLVSSSEKHWVNLAKLLLRHTLTGSWAWPIRPCQTSLRFLTGSWLPSCCHRTFSPFTWTGVELTETRRRV